MAMDSDSEEKLTSPETSFSSRLANCGTASTILLR